MKNVPKNCGIDEKEMFNILSSIKRDGSTKQSLKKNLSIEPVKPPLVHTKGDIDSLKQKEIESVNLERIKNLSINNSRYSEGAAAAKHRVAAGMKLEEKHSIDDSIDEMVAEDSDNKVNLKDFTIVKLIGKGSFGKVRPIYGYLFLNVSLLDLGSVSTANLKK